MTIQKQVTVLLLVISLVFGTMIWLNLSWLKGIERFLAQELLPEMGIAQAYERLATRWLALQIRIPSPTLFPGHPVCRLASDSFFPVRQLEGQLEVLLRSHPRESVFRSIREQSMALEKEIRLLGADSLLFYFPPGFDSPYIRENSSRTTEFSLNPACLPQAVKEKLDRVVERCESEGNAFRKELDRRVGDIITQIRHQCSTSLLLLGLAFLGSVAAFIRFPARVSTPLQDLAARFGRLEPGQTVPVRDPTGVQEIDTLEASFQKMIRRVSEDFQETRRLISTMEEMWLAFRYLYQNNTNGNTNLLHSVQVLMRLLTETLPKVQMARVFFFHGSPERYISHTVVSRKFAEGNEGQSFMQHFQNQSNSDFTEIPRNPAFDGFLHRVFGSESAPVFQPIASILPHIPPPWPENSVQGEALVLPLTHTPGWIFPQDINPSPVFPGCIGVLIIFGAVSQTPRIEQEMTFLKLLAVQLVSLVETWFLLNRSLRERQLKQQLEMARQIQLSTLPRSTPEIPGVEIQVACRMADEVGGDFYHFLEIGGGKLALILADISGKNIPAALRMMELKTLLTTIDLETLSPAHFLTRLNRLVCQHFKGEAFATMVLGLLDISGKTLTIANAGHLPIFCRRAEGPTGEPVRVLEFSLPAIPLGIEEMMTFGEKTFQLEPDDLLIWITDGVTECRNPQREEFGWARLQEFLRVEDRNNLVQTLFSRLEEFRGPAQPHDDITILSLKMSRS